MSRDKQPGGRAADKVKQAASDVEPSQKEDLRERDYHEDFGVEAGERGRQPFGHPGSDTSAPNAHTMDDHDEEGEGLRRRGRIAATGDEEPMAEEAARDAPDGHASR